jgi:preprotein translocase subunit SecE
MENDSKKHRLSEKQEMWIATSCVLSVIIIIVLVIIKICSLLGVIG